MSQENVEIVRQAAEAFAGGDLEAWLGFHAVGVEWRAIEGALDDVGQMVGRDAIRRYAQDWIDDFEDFTVTVEELTDVGDDRVVAVQVVAGRARQSGIETQLRYAVVYTIVDGKIVRGREYSEKSEALKALGLEE